MEVLFRIIETVANFVDGFAFVIFLWIICSRNKNRSLSLFWGATIIVAGLMVILPYYIKEVFLQITVMFVMGMVYSSLFLKQSLGKKIYFNVLWNVIFMVSNLLTFFVTVQVSGTPAETLLEPGTVHRIVILFIHKIVLIFMLFVAIYYNNKNKNGYKQWLMAVIQFSGAVIIGALLVNLSIETDFVKDGNVELVLMAIILFLMCIVVCVCQHIINIQNDYKVENEKLKNYLEEEEKEIKRIEELYDNSRIIRHDIKHYAVVIKDYLREKEYTKIEELIDGVIINHIENDTVYYTGNNSLDAILNNKKAMSKTLGIDFTVEISCSIPDDIMVDVCVILSNLLDNAIEAEKQEEKGYIKVKISMQQDMLYFSVVNKISKSVITVNPSLSTTKTDKTSHGLGVKSVKKRVKELDGIYKVKEENGEFKTIIYVPNMGNV